MNNDRETRLVNVIKHFESLIEKLDEAMATDERIKLDTEACGGFVSGLYICDTEDSIVERAIAIIKKHKECK